MGVMNRVFGYLGLTEEKDVEEEYYEHDMEEEPSYIRGKGKGNNVVSLQQVRSTTKVVLSEPRSYNEVQEIADHLRSRKSVIINLHRVRPDQAKRIIDFLSGTVYALSGDIQKLGKDIYLCTPEHVDIQGNISDWMDQDSDSN